MHIMPQNWIYTAFDAKIKKIGFWFNDFIFNLWNNVILKFSYLKCFKKDLFYSDIDLFILNKKANSRNESMCNEEQSKIHK